MKIWHDDIRRPPEGWSWARTNEEAKLRLLAVHDVEVISLDHDLGLENEDPDAENAWLRIGPCTDGTGLDLVDWMIENDCMPNEVIVHSLNSVGANRMIKTIKAAYERGFLSNPALRIGHFPYSPES